MTAAIGAVTTFFSSGIGSQLLGAVIGGAMNMVQNKMLGASMGGIGGTGGMTQMPEARGIMVNKNSNNEPIPVLYGDRRIGGTRVYVETSDGAGDTAGTEYLNIVLVLCEGQVEAATELWFNDEKVYDLTMAHQTIYGSADEVPGNKFAGTSEIEFFDGRDNQTVSTLLQNSVGATAWSNTDRLQGICYIVLKLKADADMYEGAVPTFTVRAKGTQVFNPYTQTQIPYSAGGVNPVYALYNYLTDTRYGKGLDPADIYWGTGTEEYSWSKAVNDVNTNNYFDGLVYTENSLYDNTHMMAEMANMFLIYQNGQYRLKVQTSTESITRTLTTDDILSELKIVGDDKKNRYNKVTASFSDGAQNFHDDSVIVENSGYLTEDGETLETNYEFSLCTSKTRAIAMANQKIDVSRKQRMVEVTVSHRFLNSEVGDIIGLTHSALGFTNKPFRIMRMELSMDNTIHMVLLEYDSTAH